jgi:hypothetical protein
MVFSSPKVAKLKIQEYPVSIQVQMEEKANVSVQRQGGRRNSLIFIRGNSVLLIVSYSSDWMRPTVG